MPAASRLWRDGLLVLGLLLLTGCAASRTPVAPTTPAAPAPTALPWTASVGVLESQATGTKCTATLVQQDVIVTAAHCLGDGGAAIAPSFAFFPNEGAQPSFGSLRVTGVVAVTSQVSQGVHIAHAFVGDWALLRIEPAPAVLMPIPVVSLRYAQVQARIAAGDRFFSGGYGAVGTLHLTQHANCAPVDAAQYHVFLDDGLMATSCLVRPQDSGGPLILVDIVDRPHLIGVIAGIGQVKSQLPLGVGVESANFINYLKLPAISLLPADLPPPPG